MIRRLHIINIITALLIYLLSFNLYAQEIYAMEDTKLINNIRCNMKNKPLNGIVRKYYSSGELMLEMPYTKGKRNGVARWYRPDGSLLMETKFKDAKGIKNELHSLGKKFKG